LPSIIPNDSFDIGHVVNTGGGGLASFSGVCQNINKSIIIVSVRVVYYRRPDSGYLSKKITASGTTSYQYSSQGRLLQVQTPNKSLLLATYPSHLIMTKGLLGDTQLLIKLFVSGVIWLFPKSGEVTVKVRQITPIIQ